MKIIREGHPTTPIALISPIAYPPNETQPNVVGYTMAAMRRDIETAHQRLRQAGDSHLHYVDGLKVFNETLIEQYATDQCHPDGDGIEVMADNFDRTDTVRVSLAAADSLMLDFSVFRHDTIGPSLSQIRSVDSLTLELQFDGFLDPDSALTVRDVEVFALPDSTPLPVDTVFHAWQFPDWREARRRAARAAADTLAADTIPPDTLVADTLAADTVDVGPGAEGTPQDDEFVDFEDAELQEAEPLPAPRIVVVLQSPLAPGEYLVRALGMVNITGLSATSSLPYEQAEPDADDDSGPG